MYIYAAIYFLVIPFVYLANLKNNKIIRGYIKYILIIILSVLPACRNATVGTDTSMYIDFFSWDLSWTDWIHHGTEIGFVSVIKIFHLIGIENYFYYLLFFSLMYNYLLVTSIFKISDNIFISMIVYISISTLYFFNFNVLRQSIALAFFSYSLPYLISGRRFVCYKYIFIGILFHYSSVILIAFPFIYSRINKNFKLITLISVLAIYAYTKLTAYLLEYLSVFTGADRYNNYIGLNESNGGKICILNIVILGVVSLFVMKYKSLTLNKVFMFFYYLFILMVFTYFCVSFLGLKYEGPGRILNYFYISSVFMYPFIFNLFSVSYRLLSYTIFFILSFLYIFVVFYYVPLHGILPYSFNPFLGFLF